MQKIKSIQIGSKSFTLKELSTRSVWSLFNNSDDSTSVLEQSRLLLSLSCPELTHEALLDLYPSEIEELWSGFEEVNSAFLGIIRLLGIDKAIAGMMKGAINEISIRQFASSLHPGTDHLYGTTDMASS